MRFFAKLNLICNQANLSYIGHLLSLTQSCEIWYNSGMVILGIDPGYATIGYGVIEKNERGLLRSVDYGIVSTPKDKSITERLLLVREGIQALIERFKPDCVAVEELFFNTNITTGIAVAEARGVILVTAHEMLGKVYEYTPSQVKQAITGSGRADKLQVQYMVQLLLKLPKKPQPDDAADALAIAVAHASTSQRMVSTRT